MAIGAHGQGTYTDANGDKYVGEWRDNNQHGQGTSTLVEKEIILANINNGKPHGQGITFCQWR